jgi:hypothetical protein
VSEPLTWHEERRRLGDLRARPDNPRQIGEDEARRLVRSYGEYEQPVPMLVNPDGTLLDGHQRLDVWLAEYGPEFEVDVRIPSRPLTQREWQRLTVYLHRGATGSWDWDKLAAWDGDDMLEWGFDDLMLAELEHDAKRLEAMIEAAQEEEEIPEQSMELRPKTMARILVSVPIDLAADARAVLSELDDIDGIEILYSAN